MKMSSHIRCRRHDTQYSDDNDDAQPESSFRPARYAPATGPFECSNQFRPCCKAEAAGTAC